jgi:hypothetical protein
MIYCLFNNINLLVTIDKFDLNPMLVNIKKLKPYKFIEDWILQVVLVKPSELVIDELVQTRKPNSLPIELQGFQPIKSESICNYLTPSCIKEIDVVVHHYYHYYKSWFFKRFKLINLVIFY